MESSAYIDVNVDNRRSGRSHGSVEQDRSIFDFDSHYYEAEDAFTRHQDRSLGSRGVRWADIDGRRRLVVGGKVNNYIANPTFNPVARPGALYS
nr:hypothetical protein [Micromonospora sp. DSM 115978]